jgi:hypothetical protein
MLKGHKFGANPTTAAFTTKTLAMEKKTMKRRIKNCFVFKNALCSSVVNSYSAGVVNHDRRIGCQCQTFRKFNACHLADSRYPLLMGKKGQDMFSLAPTAKENRDPRRHPHRGDLLGRTRPQVQLKIPASQNAGQPFLCLQLRRFKKAFLFVQSP